MIKKNIFLAIAVILMLLMFFNMACSDGMDVSNKLFSRFKSEDRMDAAVATVESFFQAFIEKDYKKAYAQISNDDKAVYSIEDFEKELKDVTEIIGFKVNWVEVKNNIAIVGIDITDFYDGSEKLYKDIEVSLIDEEGIWKINFW
jgi:predicted transcriptional regulator